MRRVLATLLAGVLLNPAWAVAAPANHGGSTTATPIKHLVVIFQENISFDHYFGTYPYATNQDGVPFHAKAKTPTVNGFSPALLNNNPNLLNNSATTGNGGGATNPVRLGPAQAVTSDQDHDYNDEQTAFHTGLMDLFPKAVGTAGAPPNAPPAPAITQTTGLNLGYFDGNTVTAYWNYAQHFGISDNHFGSTFGPSTVGLLNAFAGQTNGVASTLNGTGDETDDGNGGLTVVGDPDPQGDVCASPTRNQVTMAGDNIGTLLSAAKVSWGSFIGGFNLSIKNANGTTGCSRSSTGLAGTTADYVPHHSMFQYHVSTQNLAHTRPASPAEIGHDGPANHQYDILDFFTAIKGGDLPSVSFLKAPAIQDGHAGYSDPLDEQTFVVTVVNALQKSPYWESTAVVIMYDDSDGWYDHQMGPIVNQSTSPADTLTGPGSCGNGTDSALPGQNPATTPHAQGRCGHGPRLVFLVVSPWAKDNFVDHSITNQASVITFIEDNWLQSQRLPGGAWDSLSNSIEQFFDFNHLREDGTLILNPSTGEPVN